MTNQTQTTGYNHDRNKNKDTRQMTSTFKHLPDINTIGKEGIDHINVSFKAQTALGKMLFMSTTHWLGNNKKDSIALDISTEDGLFRTIENYWIWLICECPDEDKEHLRFCSSQKSKEFKKQYPARSVVDMSYKIAKAYEYLFFNNAKFKALLRNNELPFDVYYDDGTKKERPNYSRWLTVIFNKLSEVAKQEDASTEIDFEFLRSANNKKSRYK